MSVFEPQLITRVADTGEWLGTSRLSVEAFTRPLCQAVFRFIAKHVGTHGQPPSRDVILDRFPAFEFEPSVDTVSALAERVHVQHVYRELAVGVDAVMREAINDPVLAAKLMSDAASKLRTLMSEHVGIGTVDLTKQMGLERELYYRRRDARGLLGWAWPWPILNERTTGFEAAQMIVWYARPKQMKTFVLMMLVEAFHHMYQIPTMVVSRELPPPDIRMRQAAFMAKVDFWRYQHGQMTSSEEERWLDSLEAFESAAPFYVDDITFNGAEAADEIAERARARGVALIAVDGGYFFGDRDWELIGQFSARLKYHLINTIPNARALVTTQGSRPKGAKAGDDIGYGDSWLQDADGVVKMVLDRADRRIHMQTVAWRNSVGARWQINALPCVDFSQAFVDEDEDDEDGGGPHDKKPREVTA